MTVAPKLCAQGSGEVAKLLLSDDVVPGSRRAQNCRRAG